MNRGHVSRVVMAAVVIAVVWAVVWAVWMMVDLPSQTRYVVKRTSGVKYVEFTVVSPFLVSHSVRQYHLESSSLLQLRDRSMMVDSGLYSVMIFCMLSLRSSYMCRL